MVYAPPMPYNPFGGINPYALGITGLGLASMYSQKNAGRTAVGRRSFSGGGTNTLVRHKRKSFKKGKSFRMRVLAIEPAKHYSYQPNQSPMTQNTLYTTIPTAGIVQGTSNATRIGDAISVEALKIRGQFQSAVAANLYSYRIIVGWTGEEFPLGTAFGSGLGVTEVFLPFTTLVTVLSIVNPKAFTVLHDETIDINSSIPDTSEVVSFGTTVPIHQKFSYQSTASAQGKTKNLAVIIVGFVAGGATGVTSVGSCFTAMDLIFKDA